jgi:hypothetical protein
MYKLLPKSYFTKKNKIYWIFLLFILLLIILYLAIYYIYIYKLTRLHTLQNKQWITDLTNNLLLGVKDKSYLYKVQNTKIDNISFYYNYFFFHTKKYTLYIVFNLNNKFSNDFTLNVYYYNFENSKTELSQIILNFNDLKTYKDGNTLIITCGNSYTQKINMLTNKMDIVINSPTINLSLELNIDDYTTNQPTFLPRYDNIKSIVRPYFPITTTPGEWCADNPMIGKINKGKINNDIIDNGNFWFDNYIGVNDHFLSSYIWHVILNDNWLIYLLWFGEDDENRKNKATCFIVKDRKTDKVIRSGFSGSAIPPSFKMVDKINNPVDCNYTSNKQIGVMDYDSFNSYFETNEISIKFDSIKDECHRVFLYDYYKNNSNNLKSGIDKQYYDVINNYKYVEYVNMINVEIKYNGKIESFKERCIIDAMFKYDKDLPDSI